MKACRVYFRDRGGVEHGVHVTAFNRYHAFALGMHAMRRCSWSNPDYSGVEKMNIQILEGRRTNIEITKKEFETWLGSPQKAIKENDRLRMDVLMLLGRMEPDRDFKHTLNSR